MTTVTLQIPEDIVAWIKEHDFSDDLTTSIGMLLQTKKCQEESETLSRQMKKDYPPDTYIETQDELFNLLRKDPERHFLA